jgi:GNAT superfamily N-acetyltransferase
MMKLVEIKSPDELGRYATHTLPPFDAQMLVRHTPDAHWLVLDDRGQVSGRASLWWRETAPHPPHRLGVIGHFAATDENSTQLLLDHACAELARSGCTLAVGPMDGNTWRRYRLVTERGHEPPFFLEPDNPDEWPRWFTASGFRPLAQYFSALNDDLTVEDPRMARTEVRLEREGVRLRPLDSGKFIEELRRIYAVSRVSFERNFLYTPISEEEFLAQYEPVQAQVRPELVVLAEQSGQPVGFIFGLPDLAQARRGVPIDAAVLKTVAVLPGRTQTGLGSLLIARCQQAARALGFRRVIHALMHENNHSRNISGHYAKPFRRYTLFSRALGGTL